jgi:hypothetical protein
MPGLSICLLGRPTPHIVPSHALPYQVTAHFLQVRARVLTFCASGGHRLDALRPRARVPFLEDASHDIVGLLCMSLKRSQRCR